jgi:hypothetical protein
MAAIGNYRGDKRDWRHAWRSLALLRLESPDSRNVAGGRLIPLSTAARDPRASPAALGATMQPES